MLIDEAADTAEAVLDETASRPSRYRADFEVVLHESSSMIDTGATPPRRRTLPGAAARPPRHAAEVEGAPREGADSGSRRHGRQRTGDVVVVPCRAA